MTDKKRIIIGISGASGIVYGVRLLQLLKPLDIETHLVVTKTGERTRDAETDLTAQSLRELADVVYPVNDVGAVIASGSFKTMGMIIAPCSMRTLAEVATGVTSNLLTRAADVVMKERRRLVMLVREAPLHAIHLQNMLTVTQAGGIVFPPVPAFYMRPNTLEDVVDQTVARVLDLFDIDTGMARWEG